MRTNPHVAESIATACAELRRIAALEDGFDGDDGIAPSAEVVATTGRCIAIAEELGIPLADVQESCDGTINVTLASTTKDLAQLEIGQGVRGTYACATIAFADGDLGCFAIDADNTSIRVALLALKTVLRARGNAILVAG